MEDFKHTNEFGEIEVLKGTKYWFKKDFQTIKKSFKSAIKYSPIIFMVSLIIAVFASNFNYKNIETIIYYTIIFFPITVLGYLMFYVIFTKGYDIDPYGGTHINSPEYSNRFSVGYILNSNMSGKRKVLFIVRLAFYLLIVGLLIVSAVRKLI